MGKNAYAKALREREDMLRKAEHDTYVQYMQDIFCIVLNDQKVTGKNALGRERLTAVLKAVGETYDKFYDALRPYECDEADYYQVKMDSILQRLFQEDFSPFPERYQFLINPR